MKVNKHDYDALRVAVLSKHSKDIQHNYREQGLSDKRYRWDLLWASKFNFGAMYDYCNDTHIDTALRKIIRGLNEIRN